ncbi:MAG: hypothetical protein L3J11_00445 [Draconibacterium sp.]|nr:hypothetical protein [Draconibacterium sp.]
MENQNEKILSKFQAEEKKSKKRMLLYSSIPIILTIVLIVISYLSVDNANKQVQNLETQKQNLEVTINELNNLMRLKTDSLAEMRKVMEMAINYKDKRYSFNFSIDKELFSVYPKQTQLLTAMREMIDDEKLKWLLGGNSPEKGFDSPSFATYMINKFAVTKIDNSNRYKLREVLPKIDSSVEVGDLVFYEHGYAMFYFRYRGKPFVVGMTPIGLTSLTLDFGPKIIGYGKVSY